MVSVLPEFEELSANASPVYQCGRHAIYNTYSNSSPSLPCAVKTCALSVGDRPTRQLPVQPVAIGVAVEVTKRSKPSV